MLTLTVFTNVEKNLCLPYVTGQNVCIKTEENNTEIRLIFEKILVSSLTPGYSVKIGKWYAEFSYERKVRKFDPVFSPCVRQWGKCDETRIFPKEPQDNQEKIISLFYIRFFHWALRIQMILRYEMEQTNISSIGVHNS